MKIVDKTVLVTGANRGIGQALVQEALRRGAKRVYAGTRHAMAHEDERVTPVILDVTNGAQIERAVAEIELSTSSSTTLVSRYTTTSAIVPCSSGTSRSTSSARTA